MLNRRNFVKTAVAAGVGAVAQCGNLVCARDEKIGESSSNPTKPIVIHQTDMFHPHGDPDDHFDLATLYSLAFQNFLDLRGIVLDYPPAFRKGDPAIAAIAQMNRMTRKVVPFVVGANLKVKKRNDPARDLAPSDSLAIEFLIDALEKTSQPLCISIVGSATDVAIASSRRPDLFREKCAGVYVNSGGAHQNPDRPEMLEFNVRLNPSGYATLFDLPCPLYWFPCWHTVELRESGENGTFYWAPHKDALANISQALQGFFAYMFEESNDPHWIKAIETPVAEASMTKILSDRRGMWSTASLLRIANKTVLRNGEVVDLTSDLEASNDVLFRMENVRVTCDDAGKTTWEFCNDETGRKMFHILDVANYPSAMTRALNTLFLSFE